MGASRKPEWLNQAGGQNPSCPPALCRMEAAQLQQLQQQLSACQDEKAVLSGTVVRLERELQSARYDVEELEGARLRKRQRDSAAAAADGARVTELERQLADCQTQLRACLAENAKLKDEARRRSSGGSHAGEGVQQQPQQQQPQQQPQQQQPQQQPQQGQEQQGQQGQEQQPGGPPAGDAAEMDAGSGGAAAAVVPAAVQQAPGEAELKLECSTFWLA